MDSIGVRRRQEVGSFARARSLVADKQTRKRPARKSVNRAAIRLVAIRIGLRAQVYAKEHQLCFCARARRPAYRPAGRLSAPTMLLSSAGREPPLAGIRRVVL